jgi:hypothetical protein
VIQFDSPYKFEVEDFSFGNLNRLILIELFVDGRVASKFLERHIPIWFSELTFVDKAGYDFIHEDGSRYEAKCFTKSGLNYSASKYQGVGREIDINEHTKHASSTNYILCDVVSFPIIRVVFFDGKTLLSRYPTGLIKYAERHRIFCERSNLLDGLSSGDEATAVQQC